MVLALMAVVLKVVAPVEREVQLAVRQGCRSEELVAGTVGGLEVEGCTTPGRLGTRHDQGRLLTRMNV